MTHTSRLTAFLLIAFIAATFVASTGCGVAKDTKLQIKIKDALAADKTVPHDKLIVNVAAGVVTISGHLNTQTEIDHVVQLVQAIPGVTQVKNQMSLPDNWHSNNPTFMDYPLN